MTDRTALTEHEWRVWRTFTAMRRQLDRAVEQQLQEEAGISRPEFEILQALWEAPEKRLRARDIAELIDWEKSRISHQVTRMEGRGLVTRADCRDDLRGTWVTLTDEGRRAVVDATRDHGQTVRSLFFDVLSDDEQDLLLEVSRRVLDTMAPPACEIMRARAQAV